MPQKFLYIQCRVVEAIEGGPRYPEIHHLEIEADDEVQACDRGYAALELTAPSTPLVKQGLGEAIPLDRPDGLQLPQLLVAYGRAVVLLHTLCGAIKDMEDARLVHPVTKNGKSVMFRKEEVIDCFNLGRQARRALDEIRQELPIAEVEEALKQVIDIQEQQPDSQ